jgi:hydroxysqualene dehydroxylase
MKRPTIHVIGAGLSGLSAAAHLAALARFDLVVHERGREAGGRRRAFFDEADQTYVDSVNIVAWPHWRATRALIKDVGAEPEWRQGAREIAFVDMRTAERWTLRPGSGRLPWWALLAKRRAPGLAARDYFHLARLGRGAVAPDSGLAAERLWRPLSIAALNLAPESAALELLIGELEEALAGPKQALLHPRRDLAHALLLPLTQHLERQGAAIRFERTLQALRFERDRVVGMEFAHDHVELSARDAVLLAVPPWVAAPLTPGLLAPDAFTATITAHFSDLPPVDAPDLTCVLNGPVHAVFKRAGGISVTVRDAGADIETPKEALAAKYWSAVAAVTGLSDELPAWRLIKQKRAAFAATPAQNALRPGPTTAWRNLALAGSYVRYGLAESMETAIRSGEHAARCLAQAL